MKNVPDIAPDEEWFIDQSGAEQVDLAPCHVTYPRMMDALCGDYSPRMRMRWPDAALARPALVSCDYCYGALPALGVCAMFAAIELRRDA